MKMKLIKGIRIGIIIAFGISAISLTTLAIKTYQTPVIKEEEKVKYEYSNAVNVNYDVFVMTNKLYTKDKLEEQPFYLTKFVKDITVKFNMLFNSSTEAKINGEYEITAQLQGYEIEQEEKHVIWTKKIESIPKVTFDKNDKGHSITTEISIPYKTYNDFTDAIMEEARANTEAEIIVNLIGKKSIVIGDDTKEVPIKAVAAIPLVKSYFGITKEGTKASKEVGKETIKIEIPPNKDLVIFDGILAFTSLLGMAAVLLFTKQSTLEDKYINKRKGLFREHGSRMVAVDYIEEPNELEHCRVLVLDDLIKIADEIEKPVFYKQDEDVLKITKFYVRDQNLLYMYEVSKKESEEIQNENQVAQVKKLEKEEKVKKAKELKEERLKKAKELKEEKKISKASKIKRLKQSNQLEALEEIKEIDETEKTDQLSQEIEQMKTTDEEI